MKCIRPIMKVCVCVCVRVRVRVCNGKETQKLKYSQRQCCFQLGLYFTLGVEV